MKTRTNNLVEQYIRKFGEDILESKLNIELSKSTSETLTIIANAGTHPLRDEHVRGEIFLASEGMLDFSDEKLAIKELESILIKVSEKLKSRPWKRVFIVPFGPAILSMQIKSLIYKVLNFESIDILHAGSGVHYDIQIDIKKIAAS